MHRFVAENLDRVIKSSLSNIKYIFKTKFCNGSRMEI